MMIDKEHVLCSAQAVTADADATNVIDLQNVRHIGDGNGMSVFVQVGVAADSTTGDETYKFNVVTDDNASLSSDTIVVDRTIAAALLTAGSIHEIKIPQGATLERYLGLAFDVGGTTPTITVTAWLGETGSLPSVRTYANGYDV